MSNLCSVESVDGFQCTLKVHDSERHEERGLGGIVFAWWTDSNPKAIVVSRESSN